MDEKSLTELTAHIRDHVTYPIAKTDFLAACQNMMHVPPETVKWVSDNLPDRTFRSSEDVLHTLDLPHSHSH